MSGMSERLIRLAAAARRASEHAEDTRAARDRAIAEAESGGWSMSAIAEATGLSVSQVGRIAVAQTHQAQAAEPTERIDVH